jgi:hypothetical protein
MRAEKAKKEYKNQSQAIFRRPQFISNNIHRGEYLRPLEKDEYKISLTSPPIDVDATADIIAVFGIPSLTFNGNGRWVNIDFHDLEDDNGAA